MNAIDLTRRLLALKTMNPPGQERSCARWLGGLLAKAGFKIRYCEFDRRGGRTSLIAWTKAQAGHKHICFLGHLDTVPLGITPWSRDPFRGVIEGDKLYGRGASDMKGGVAAFVSAALRASRDLRGPSGLMLMLTAGEESGCQGAFSIAQVFEKLPPVGAVLLAEPTLNYPCIAHKGVIWLEAQSDGIAAHGSLPDQGVNAIYKATRAIQRLQALSFGGANHPLLGAPTLNVGTIAGGSATNIVPERTVFTLDIRTIPGQSHEAIYRQLEVCLGTDARISNRRLDCPSIETPARLPWVQAVYAIMAPILKARPEPRGLSYFTDAAALSQALGNPPVVILGPGDINQAHKTDEYCLVSNIAAAETAYYRIMMEWSDYSGSSRT